MKSRRIVSLLLCLCLVIGLVPSAFADGEEGESMSIIRDEEIQTIITDYLSSKGIAPERLATVFTLRGPEYSNADSAGLGLLVAQGIVQLHGGSLLIHGDEKKGTHVRAMLPATNNVLLRDDADFAPGASLILLELSPVLDAKAYDNRYRD